MNERTMKQERTKKKYEKELKSNLYNYKDGCRVSFRSKNAN